MTRKSWVEQLQETWLEAQKAVDDHDIDKLFVIVKRLLFIKRQMTIKY